MKSFGWAAIVALSLRIAQAQTAASAPNTQTPLTPPQPTPNSLSFGFGTTTFPTPIVAAQSITQGGGGFEGGNFTLTVRGTHDISSHWRIPVSVSTAFLRGDLIKTALIVPAPNDTTLTQFNISNSVDVFSAQVGIEYYDPQPLITLFGGADIMYSYITSATLNWIVEYDGSDIVHQTLPAMSRWGVVLRGGGECPLPIDNWYFDATAELGAINVLGRTDTLQLFTPTQESRDVSAARVANGQTGEDIATFIRFIVSVAYRF